MGTPIGRLFGIEIRVTFGWLVILAIVAYLAVSELQLAHPELDQGVSWILGLAVAVAFFLSSTAHDFAHAIVARRRGVPVSAVSVSFFGGATPADAVATTARDDLAIAIAGPIVSVALGVVLGVASVGFAAVSGPAWETTASTIAVVAVLNLILGLVNLAPAYPLDGGRIVRAVGWWRGGSIDAGWRVAARVGRGAGMVTIGLGFVLMLSGPLANGAMTALSGWFLVLSARSISERLRVDRLIGGFHVSDAMEASPVSVGPHLTVDTFAGQLLDDGADMSAVPVVSEGDVIGVLGIREVKRLQRRLWPTTRVEDIMAKPPRFSILSAGESLGTAVERLYRAGLDGLPVVDGGTLVGILTRRSVGRLVHERTLLTRGGRTAG